MFEIAGGIILAIIILAIAGSIISSLIEASNRRAELRQEAERKERASERLLGGESAFSDPEINDLLARLADKKDYRGMLSLASRTRTDALTAISNLGSVERTSSVGTGLMLIYAVGFGGFLILGGVMGLIRGAEDNGMAVFFLFLGPVVLLLGWMWHTKNERSKTANFKTDQIKAEANERIRAIEAAYACQKPLDTLSEIERRSFTLIE